MGFYEKIHRRYHDSPHCRESNVLDPKLTILLSMKHLEKSSSVILHDHISELLEVETFPSDEPDTVMNAVTMYKSCLDMRTIEQLATVPIIEMVNMYGGWPMINQNWNPNRYNIMDVVGKLSHLSVGVFINSQVVPSFEDSTVNVMIVSNHK